MATMLIRSENPDFSQIIRKNPASPMRVKQLKRGTILGYYHVDDPKTYCIAFIDGHDEVSLKANQDVEFEYIDSTRYNSPLFAFNAVREYLGSNLSSVDPLDVVGHQHEVIVTAVDVQRVRMFKRIVSFLDGFEVELRDSAVGGSPSLVIRTKRTIHELVNLVYVLSVLQVIMAKVNLYVDNGLTARLVSALNIINAPYYVRYIVRLYMIHSSERFAPVKDQLANVVGHSVVFAQANGNATARMSAVVHAVPTDVDVLDVGCGEGSFLRIAKSLREGCVYHAVDRDPLRRADVEHKLSYGELENVVLHENLSSFVKSHDGSPFVAMFNEVIEHNSLNGARAMLHLILGQPGCRRAFITTPNRAFNVNYALGDELRHDDHKFELTRCELTELVNSVIADLKLMATVNYTPVGDVVDGEATTLMLTVNLDA